MKNVNADFLLDIWADLKAKRLAPVAVGLAVAVIAMPALLLKGEDAPSAGPLPIVATPSSADNGAEVELADELADGSKLDSYKAHNPFDGVAKSADDAAGVSGTAIAPGDGASDDAAQDIAKVLGGSSPSSGSGSSPSVGGSGTPGGLTTPGSTPSPVVRKPGAKYTYELDVKFGRPGNEQRYPHLTRMSFLPSPKAPALLFMGVPADEKSAIFFVYPTLSHQGEGICLPSRTNCNFLQLRIGRDHFLQVGDHEYRIHLIDVDRVKLQDQGGQPRKTAGTQTSGRAGEGAPGDDGDEPDYGWPVIVDGIG